LPPSIKRYESYGRRVALLSGWKGGYACAPRDPPALLSVRVEATGLCARRYRANFVALRAGMKKLGFELYVPESDQGVIISTFLWPDDAKFDFYSA